MNTPIYFEYISRMSAEKATLEDQYAVAHEVLSTHGLDGLVTLWMCLDYYVPWDFPPEQGTPAAQWWLREGNTYASMVRRELVRWADDERQATELLFAVATTPLVNGEDEKPGRRYHPERRQNASNCNATTVRALATTFFPDFLGMQEPTSWLYQLTYDTNPDDLNDLNDPQEHQAPLYKKPFQAFPDPAAQKYLACVLPQRVVASYPELLAFRHAKDPEWSMYEGMGLDLEDSYKMAKQVHSAPDALPLPCNLESEI